MYRRIRRNKLWYRKPRFNNRVASKKKGWLAPSIKHKLDSQIRVVDLFNKYLPITKVIMEVANFDIQKIKNPEINGKEYQEGEQKDFWNIREYVLHRDKHTCQHCKKSGLVLNVHHIVSRKIGGDRPENLITLCKGCHKKFHEGKIKLNVKKLKGFRDETFMNIVRWRMFEILKQKYPDVEVTFGYLTKSKRIAQKLEKTHYNDAFCIANGTDQERSSVYIIKQKRRNNRRIQQNRRGFKPSVRKRRYSIQPGDLVKVGKKEYINAGVFNKGTYVRVKDSSNIVFNFNVKKIEKVFNFGGLNNI